MVMQLDRVVPFGRSLDEYIHLFNLTAADLQKSILSVADGPASFNAEGTKLGYSIQSIDPLYGFSADQIRARFDEVVDDIIQQIQQTPNDWVWSYHRSPDELRQNRERAMRLFCEDYELGKASDRYAMGELPRLNLPDHAYELGLCSHFLFLYSDHFDQDFHIAALQEMLRVCREVRVFPLLTLMLQPSPHVQPVLDRLTQDGLVCTIETVAYELQKGGNQMLRIVSR